MRRFLSRLLACAFLAALPAAAAFADALSPAQLRDALAAAPSATVFLGRRCGELHLATPPAIRAVAVKGAQKSPDAAVLAALKAGVGEPIRYRRVRLVCGDKLLSEADNWYRPGQLTADMNRELDRTDTPFGAVVKPLDFHRIPLKTAVLAGPAVLEVRAVLAKPDGTPFSLVVEDYRRVLLGR